MDTKHGVIGSTILSERAAYIKVIGPRIVLAELQPKTNIIKKRNKN